MPPIVIAAGVAAAGVTAGAVISKSASDNQAEAAKEAAKAGSDSTQKQEEITHKLPVESGAATAQGYGLASDFDQAQNAALQAGNEQGIDFGDNLGRGRGALASTEDMGGLGSGNAPDREGEYASIQLMKKTTDATRLKVKFLGVDDGSGANPGGVKMSLDEFIVLQRLKDPSVLIHNGQSLTDPVDDSEIAGVMPEMVPGYASMSDADKATWTSRYSLLNMMAQDPQMSGDTLAAMAENDPTMASAIAFWKGKGVIDKMNNQNAGQISKIGQKLTKTVVEDRVMTPLTPEQKQQYTDQYDAATKQVADPKNVKVEHIGSGMTRTTVLNADGSTAMQTIDGDITLPTGQKVPVTMAGSSGKDFQGMQDLADSTGGLFADAASGKHSSTPKKSSKPEDATTDDTSASQPEGYAGADLGAAGDAETTDETAAEGGVEESGDTSGASGGGDIGSISDPNSPNYDPSDPAYDPTLDSSSDSYDPSLSADPSQPVGNQLPDHGPNYSPAPKPSGSGKKSSAASAAASMASPDGPLGDPMMPGTPGTSSGPGGSGSSGDMETELNGLITKVPKQYQQKVADFWSQALDQDPSLTTEDLVGMLPDELQQILMPPKTKKGHGPQKRPSGPPTVTMPGSSSKKKPKSSSSSSGGSDNPDLDQLLQLLQDHPELASQIMSAINKVNSGAA